MPVVAPTPSITNDDFVTFLYWLKDNHGFSAEDILDVLQKPGKYWSEYSGFLLEREQEWLDSARERIEAHEHRALREA